MNQTDIQKIDCYYCHGLNLVPQKHQKGHGRVVPEALAQEAVKRLKLGEIRKKKIVIKNGIQNSLRCKVPNLSAVT